jgi:hypothetical protein
VFLAGEPIGGRAELVNLQASGELSKKSSGDASSARLPNTIEPAETMRRDRRSLALRGQASALRSGSQ